MQPQSQIIFDPFRMDLTSECLWLNNQPVQLTPKAFALLRYLVERAGQLVTKEELLNEVWPNTYVSDAVLKVCIGELRKALGDDAKQPRFIKTSHRRGYLFIGNVARDAPPPKVSGAAKISPSFRSSRAGLPAIVGREAELVCLQDWLERARRGERQVIFVTGEPGIGKSSLIETFLERVAGDQEIWIARGQCLEQYGTGEPYLPVLEALSGLCREPGRDRMVALLRQQAPMWLAQMPWLVTSDERDRLQQAMMGATRERMLREIAEAFESLAADTLLVMTLEDLHWSDYSTLDLVSLLARRRAPAQLMIIGTYRPVEVSLSDHPLRAVKQELQMHRQCKELPLAFLTEESITDYLAARFVGSDFPVALTRVFQQRTGGNPLFMVNVGDYLVSQGLVVEFEGGWKLKDDVENLAVEVPDDVWQVIEKQIERLNHDQQRVLEAASVVGTEFSVAAVSAGLLDEPSRVEQHCEELARRQQFLRPVGTAELPNGTLTTRYAFIHALYQNALYRRVGATRRAALHQRIGEQGEAVYGDRGGEIAAELAMHFEQSRDFKRASTFFTQAAENAIRHFAHPEAVTLARRGLALLRNVALGTLLKKDRSNVFVESDPGFRVSQTAGEDA